MLLYWSWGVLFFCLFSSVHAGVVDVQDNNSGMAYSGSWTPDASPLAHGKHETWTNQSGASVYYDFTGTQVKVFATMRPNGTYLTNVSFAIDSSAPTFWTTTAPVPNETFNKLVYTSDTLSNQLHRITVTNYGVIFWLVYMEYTTVDSTSTTSTASGISTSNQTGVPANTASSHTHTSLIIGVVVGVVGGLALLAAIIWCLCVRSKARRRELAAMAATPFAAQPDPSSHFSKDHPPAVPTSRYPRSLRWFGGSQGPASDRGIGTGYPSSGASEDHSNPRPHSAPPDPEALKQLAIFRDNEAARTAPQLNQSAPQAPRPLPAPPPMRMLPGTGPANIPSVPETAYPSTTRTRTTQNNAPVSRSAWFARALSFSSARRQDPALSASDPSEYMPSAIASSPILPPPSATTRSGSSDPNRAVFLRVPRRSRDGGVRLAGGAPEAQNTNMWTPAEYDRVLEAMSEGSTLPPSYQQHHSNVNDRAQMSAPPS